MEPSQELDPFGFLKDVTEDQLDEILFMEEFEQATPNKKLEQEKLPLVNNNLQADDAQFTQNLAETEAEKDSDICSLLTFNRQPSPTFDTPVENENNASDDIGQQTSRDFSLNEPMFNDPSNDINLSLYSSCSSQMPLESVIMKTQDIEMIALNDSATQNPKTFEDALNDMIQDNYKDQTTIHSSQRLSNISSKDLEAISPLTFAQPKDPNALIDMSLTSDAENQTFDSSFEMEFAKFANANFDDDLELDFDEINALEKTLMDKKANSALSRQIKTQISPSHKNDAKEKQVSISCPPLKRFEEASCINPMNFLSINYSVETGEERKGNASQDRVESIESGMPETLSTISRCNSPELPTPIEDTAIPKSLRPTYVMENFENVSQLSTKDEGLSNLEFIIGKNSAADVTLVPMAVKQLFDIIKSKYSDFAFVYALSAQLCQDHVPMDCFVNLKMALLLSLVSIGNNPDRPPIPIIAIGYDTNIINYLMLKIGQLAERFIGPTDNTKPPSSTNYKQHNWIEAPPVLLAKGGIFYIGDWSRLKLASADKLFKYIECSSVGVDKTSYQYPLETAIWGHWRSFKCNAKDQQSFNKFAKIFGIPVYVDETNHETLVDYILQQYSIQTFESTTDHLSISNEDMRHYVSIISKRTVDLSQEASILLQKYFVASRIERPDSLTKQALVVLKQYSESFAKLAMRHEVLEIDVVAAIYLAESFLQNIFGCSETPPPLLKSHSYVASVDNELTMFQKWLNDYINRFYNIE